MLNYSVRVQSQTKDERNNFYIKLQITDVSLMDTREINVKFTTLQELHNRLISDNPYYELPEFPQKDKVGKIMSMIRPAFFKSEEEIQKNTENAFNEYFKQIMRCNASRLDALIKFLRDGADAIRFQELSKLEKQFATKQELFNEFVKIDVIHKSYFKKSYLVESNEKTFILHKFTLPNNDQVQRYMQSYFDAHVKINDFTYLSKILYIFRLKGQGAISSWWKSSKSSNPKNSPYNPLGYYLDEKKPHEYIWSIEEKSGITLQEEIDGRVPNGNQFTFDELLQLAQTLITGMYTLHKQGIAHRQLSSANIQYNIGGAVKISGVADPTIEFEERLNLLQQKTHHIHQPPEIVTATSSGIYNNINLFKVDSWAVGVALLQAATLKKSRDFYDIHQINSVSLIKYIRQVHETYGPGFASIISVMTLRNPKDRSDLQEQIQNVFQTHLVPMRTDFLEPLLKQPRPKLIRYRLNLVDDVNLKKLHKDIQENQKKVNPIYEMYITLKSADEQLLILNEQLKIIQIKKLILMINNPQDLEMIFSILLKDLNIQNLDLVVLKSNKIPPFLDYLKSSSVMRLKLDIQCKLGKEDLDYIFNNPLEFIKTAIYYDGEIRNNFDQK